MASPADFESIKSQQGRCQRFYTVWAEQVRQLALEGMAPSVSYQVRIDRSGSRPKLVWIDERDGRAQVLRHEPGSLWRRLNAWVAGMIGLEKML